MAVIRNFRLPEGIGVSADYIETFGFIQSTSPSLGAIVSRGGVGVGNSISIAGRLQLFNGSYYTAFVSSATANTLYTLPPSTPATGSSVLQSNSSGVMSWVAMSATSSGIAVAAATASTTLNLIGVNAISGSGLAISSGTGLTYNLSTSTLTSGSYSGNWAGSTITGFYGGTGFNSYTKGDLLVGAGTTLIKQAVGTQNQILIADLFSGSGLSWATFANPTYGSFYSTSTQQVVGAGLTTLVTFNNTYESNRVSIIGGAGTSSRIQLQDAGPFSITFSAQINLSSGTQPQKGDFWFRVNGQDIPQSNSISSITGKDYQTLITVNFVYTFATNDYFEIAMSSPDAVFTIEASSGLVSPPRPSIPSIILSVLPITHIVGASGAGISGILSLNGSTVSQQYFLTGTTGTDFNVQTASGNHTFNIPIAGIASTGLLTSQAQTIGGLKTFASGISITSSTASTSTSTGALIITGGVGIGSSIIVGGRVGIGTNVLTDGTLTVNTVTSSNPGIRINTVASQSRGAIEVTSTSGSGGTVFVIYPQTTSASSKMKLHGGTINHVDGREPAISIGSYNTPGSGIVIRGTNGSDASPLLEIQNNPGSILFSVGGAGAVVVASTTTATSTSTGALTVTGGVGIGGSIYGGSTISAADNIEVKSAKEVRFNNTGNTFYTGIKAGANASNTTYTLPIAFPGTGTSVLQSDTSGTLTWVAMTATGSGTGTTANSINVSSALTNASHPILFSPSTSNVVGSAVSSDASLFYNPSTKILSVSGLAITAGTASTSTFTGALLVNGGVGISGQVSFTRASLGFTGVTGTPTMAFIGATTSSYISLNVLSDNSLSWEGSSGQLFSIDNNLSTGEIFAVSDISGLPIISASAGQTVSLNEFGGYTKIGNGSISSTGGSSIAADGTLVVNGGIGITGNANIGGTVRINNTTNSINVGSGGLVVSGGAGIGQSVSIGGRLQLFNGSNYSAFVSAASGNTLYTLPATSPATGSSVLQSTSAGVMSWVPMVSSGGLTDGMVQYKSGSSFGGTLSLFFDSSLLSLRISGFPGGNVTSSTDAALKLETTVGSFNGSTNGTYIAVNAPNGFTGDLVNLQVNASSKFRIDNTGAIIQTAGTNASSTTTGTLQVRGGVGITGNAYIGGATNVTNTTAATSTSTGALTVSGGAGIGQTLFVGGSVFVGTNTFSKNLGVGDFALDNGSTDTPAVLFYYKNNTNFGIDTFSAGAGSTRFRIVKDLNEAGGSELWSIDRSGIVTQTAWDVGEVIASRMYNYSDLGMSATTTISSTSYTTFATITYTPKSSSSYLWIEFSCTYTIAGAAADDFWSNIEVAGAEQVNSNQVWLNGAGGGTRSGVLFPLACRYTNTGTAGIAISVRSKRGTSDDNATIYGNTSSGYMRIQEIGR